jgi:uncharacterized RDD family membrane protein YckC
MLDAPPGSAGGSIRASREGANGAGPRGGLTTAYAGFVTRTIAIVLDGLLIVAAALAVTAAVLLIFAVFALRSKHIVAVVVGGLAFVIWVICYFAVFWTSTGQTPGNRVMHICVVRSDGTRLRPRQAVIRLGAMALSLPLFWGYLPIFTSARRRGVPDALADTVVIVADGPFSPPSPDPHSGDSPRPAVARVNDTRQPFPRDPPLVHP